jgi:hypothetical protein
LPKKPASPSLPRCRVIVGAEIAAERIVEGADQAFVDE